jgi:Fic family protein
MIPKNLLIWQLNDWPKFTTASPAVAAALLQARKWQGEVIGRAAAVGLTQSGSVLQEVMMQEVIATAAIEGEKLDPASVRSSILRQLGHFNHQLPTTDAAPRSRHVDGLVDVIQDATLGFKQALTEDRLLRWQSALFPGGTSGIRRIAVGRYRDHSDLMQIVSGQPGKEVIHYTAPPSSQVSAEMQAFLAWFAETSPQNGRMDGTNGITRAAIAHLWFESIHPFEDGNGRIGRAIMDMALAQDLGEATRLYSISSQLMQHRKGYYDALHQAQHGSLDVSAWVLWLTQQFSLACQATCALIDRALEKSTFWQTHSATPLNERQRKVIQRLLDDGDGGFLGGLNADKYMKMTSTSKATATRDLADLVKNGLLRSVGQGKAVRYHVAVTGWVSGSEKQVN